MPDKLGIIVMGMLAGALLLGAALVFYFLPTIIARNRRARDFRRMAVLNVLLGWTGVFWITLLLVALALPRRREE